MEKKEDKLEEYQKTVFYYPKVNTNNIEPTKETDQIIRKQKSWVTTNVLHCLQMLHPSLKAVASKLSFSILF